MADDSGPFGQFFIKDLKKKILNPRMVGCIDGLIDVRWIDWLDGWMNGWIDGLMVRYGWIDRWMNE